MIIEIGLMLRITGLNIRDTFLKITRKGGENCIWSMDRDLKENFIKIKLMERGLFTGEMAVRCVENGVKIS